MYLDILLGLKPRVSKRKAKSFLQSVLLDLIKSFSPCYSSLRPVGFSQPLPHPLLLVCTPSSLNKIYGFTPVVIFECNLEALCWDRQNPSVLLTGRNRVLGSAEETDHGQDGRGPDAMGAWGGVWWVEDTGKLWLRSMFSSGFLLAHPT